MLVLTPEALQSRYVRDEWKLARQEGKAVWPVSGPGELDLSRLPRWMARANRHDIDIPESRDRLILGLKGPAREKRVPFMADPLPTGFVERPEKFAEIKKKLLDAQGEPVAITAALRGAGGFGKTALANALCHDPEIEDAFSDGILRMVLGEKPEDLVGRIADLIEILTGERPGVTQLEGAKAKLAESLDDRRCLLVIDDAWREQDLAPFLHRGPRDQTTRLITTRDDRVLPAEAARVAVDAMTSNQAMAMLTRGLADKISPSLESRLTTLAVRLGEWPLLLGLANGVLRARTARGSSFDNALSYAERALTQRGLADAFAARDRAVRRTTASGTLRGEFGAASFAALLMLQSILWLYWGAVLWSLAMTALVVAMEIFPRQHQTYKLSSARIQEATVMYLRPASWAMRTASAIGRLRTEASFTSAGRLTPASTSTRACSMIEMPRFDGVPPNMSVSTTTPSPVSQTLALSRISARRFSMSSSALMQTAVTPCCGPTTCSRAAINSRARLPWATSTMPIIRWVYPAPRRGRLGDVQKRSCIIGGTNAPGFLFASHAFEIGRIGGIRLLRTQSASRIGHCNVSMGVLAPYRISDTNRH